MVLDIEQLLAPISPESPTGIDVRQDADGAAVYYRIKDARATARLSERRADAEAEGGPLAPEWRQIRSLAIDLLTTRAKDIEVAVWLTEAALRIDGYSGLRDSFTVLDGLVERYWEILHSLDQEDIGAKVAPLAGLNGLGNEGALIQPLRLAPITAPKSGDPAGLWHYMVMRKRGAAAKEAVLLDQAAKATAAADFKAIYTDIHAAASAYSSLIKRLDAACGENAPPSSTISNTLAEAQDALRDVSGLDASQLLIVPAAPTEAAVDAGVAGEPAAAEAAPAAAAGPAPLVTRDDALRELARLATFFRETEPNSPIAYTLETAIRRAKLPLKELLAELIPDEAVRRNYLTVAGIWPDSPT